MNEAQRLPGVATAPSHIHLAAHYDWRSGWRLSVAEPGDAGRPRSTRRYDGLSSRELLDVACSELARLLAADTPSV